MNPRTVVLRLGIILPFAVFFFSGCKKINEGTVLGSGLIPTVDNVTTFETNIPVETYNGLFTDANDSTLIGSGAEHFVGNISNDPLFGTTKASLYFELKPQSFPYTFDFIKTDSILHFDSIVLVLDYTRTFGDSSLAAPPLNLTVREIDQASNFRVDSNYLIRSNTFTLGPVLGSLSGIIPASLDDSVFAFKDTTKNQLRIPLSNTFGMRMLSYDTSVYKTDSAFRSKFKGFAIVPDVSTGNSLLGISLLGKNTKLAFYYHYKRGVITDTSVVTYFNFGGLCAHANLVERNYTGTPLLANQGGPGNFVFLQNTPGTFATVKIPGLTSLPNCVVYRAELVMEQVYDLSPSSDQIFSVPSLLFLDAYDTAKLRFRSVPYDFLYDPTSGANSASFGMLSKKSLDASNNSIAVWKFNITRYVQNYLTRKEPLYNLRLTAPFSSHDLYGVAGGTDQDLLFSINPTIAAGRVRLGGGNHPTQKMRLHIIYSKL